MTEQSADELERKLLECGSYYYAGFNAKLSCIELYTTLYINNFDSESVKVRKSKNKIGLVTYQTLDISGRKYYRDKILSSYFLLTGKYKSISEGEDLPEYLASLKLGGGYLHMLDLEIKFFLSINDKNLLNDAKPDMLLYTKQFGDVFSLVFDEAVKFYQALDDLGYDFKPLKQECHSAKNLRFFLGKVESFVQGKSNEE